MRIESKLCHLSENKAIVQVCGWLNDKNVGSALGEASTVELAEDNAISRLRERLNVINKNETNIKMNTENIMRKEVNIKLPNSKNVETLTSNNEPSDWSNELAAIDTQIERLNWSRDDEIKFLEENLGYNNRNKITNYKELIKYLSILKKINTSNSNKLDNQNIQSIIDQSDVILRELSWDNKQGREYLQKEFNVSTRKELNEDQLISFVAKLKSIQNQ